ncbi:cytochrome-c peroxidase [Chryseobacterium jejuense]|uniref:Methylamine utilization protein MauG n=1 Tax=Chryseobacterium jejuense TaxID=445960 RepID=A0A2X2WYQ7_CHRJE|nr:cytochrome c peroxidase [Chryseobacterium jejuense]SDJ40581.1 cytochrome c peroxidase [Chryseobacterium jejuense]SQB45956.1 Cytochrome c551 peroxidase precursor [Chryseobacterium jejuense]
MKKLIYWGLGGVTMALLSFTPKVNQDLLDLQDPTIEDIVKSYKKAISEWPKPNIDYGVKWQEFSPIKTDSAYFTEQDKPNVILGKMLFFDPKLSQSNQISCSSCHDPEMGWSDRRHVALGNNHLQGNRNTISLYNIAERNLFFWDGRAKTLEEQAAGPLGAHHEMAMDVKTLPAKIQALKGYKPLFKNAYGDEKVTYDRIVKAIADFQKTIKSQPSRFDKFLEGKYNALSDEEIYGMHVFRTKARCMNCHSGQYLTDESFHNIGLTYYKRKYEDLGLYTITQKAEDVGKFKTPQLRDLMLTQPWMHNGLFGDLEGVVNMYNSGMHMIDPSAETKLKDPLYPVTDPLLKPLKLTKEEKQALISFLEALSGTKYKMRRPEFPVE